MHSSYLRYINWKSLNKWRKLYGGTEIYGGSAQFEKCGLRPGDTLWTATLRPESFELPQTNDLILCGQIEVGQITEDPETVLDAIERVLGSRLNVEKLWSGERDYTSDVTYAIARLDTTHPYETVAISRLVPQLRFRQKSGAITRLKTGTGATLACGLQSVRRLTPECATMLREAWNNQSLK